MVTETGTSEGKAGASREGSGGRGEKKGVRWSMMCKSTGKSTRGAVPIRFGNYNIRNGSKMGMELALRGVSQGISRSKSH